jgi:hypothetical protein
VIIDNTIAIAMQAHLQFIRNLITYASYRRTQASKMCYKWIINTQIYIQRQGMEETGKNMMG